MPAGRPKKKNEDGTDKYDIETMCEIIDKYTEDHAESERPPILKHCCVLNNWNYDHVMRLQRENDKLCQSIKKLLAQKEVWLETKALLGEVNSTMAVFSLKQLGWRDNPQVNDLEDTMNQLKEMFSNVKSNI